jgi:phage anti-repressor protein
MKTAMQELISELKSIESYDFIVLSIIKRAESKVEKEKEQIMKAYKDHHDLGHIFGLDTEQYYNQTYNL